MKLIAADLDRIWGRIGGDRLAIPVYGTGSPANLQHCPDLLYEVAEQQMCRVFDWPAVVTAAIHRSGGSMLCLMFPGQGVQRRGMGEGLFDQYPDLTAAADAELGYSLKALCLEDSGRLRDTRYAQPAVFFVNALSAAGREGEYGCFIGHSLGEYNALVAAGCLDLMTALRLVRDRAEAMAQVTDGGMAAVTGLTADRIEQVLREANLAAVFIANRNSERQTVIAGGSMQLGLAMERLKSSGALAVVPLSVSGPFHTPLMAPAARAYAAALRACEFKPGHAPVYSSVTAAPFDSERAVTALTSQVTSPVNWVRAVRRMRGDGVTKFDEVNGTTLTALVRTIR